MFLGKVNIFKSSLSKIRKKVIGDFREDALSNIICKNLEKYIDKNKNKNLNFLDYGAGYNPILIKKIIKKLSKKYKQKNFTAHCYDFYDKNKIKECKKMQERQKLWSERMVIITIYTIAALGKEAKIVLEKIQELKNT